MMTFTVQRAAPEKRRGQHDGTHEEHYPEAAVMLAFAMHLLKRGAKSVRICPDGMHTKVHDIRAALESEGFRCENGRAGCAGQYVRGEKIVTVAFRAGIGDVVGKVGDKTIFAECKGGIVNTRHRGQRSKLRKGLCESVGQLLGREPLEGERQVAVIPYTPLTLSLATRMAKRAGRIGIEIALIRPDGVVKYMKK
jgi:hypothetical protein